MTDNVGRDKDSKSEQNGYEENLFEEPEVSSRTSYQSVEFGVMVDTSQQLKVKIEEVQACDMATLVHFKGN